MQIQLNDLERQLTNLTGRIDDLGFRLDTVTDRLDRLVADVDLRLRNLEQGGLPPVGAAAPTGEPGLARSEEHTSELQSLMRLSYAVFCLKKKTTLTTQ